jgi:outer membrane protein OmpA-like peptidoglycan-associated protein
MSRILTLALGLLITQIGSAQQDLRDTLFAEADSARAAAEAANAQLLSPGLFEDGLEAYADAEADLDRGRNLDRIRDQLDDAVAAFGGATEASEIADITLASLIKTRDDASEAQADRFAAAMWVEAEELFDSAARRLESGNIRGARTRADEAETLFRDAELTAIKAQYLSQTRALLAQAEQARVPRFAPITFERASLLLTQAEEELNNNRYDTDLPRSLAQQANYEARHAIYLAERIQRLRDDDWTEEQIILAYEEPLTQIAAAADRVAQLDSGTESVTMELVAFIEDNRQREQQLDNDLVESHMRIVALEEEIRTLDQQLGGVSQERVALVQRLEAEVESGQADVDPEYQPLLTKIVNAVEIFPRSQLIIEGHTDSYGSDGTNMALSRTRAEAVGEYLGTEFNIPSFRISAVGYGETRPIANNETPQGRARNRRIDILIEPQLE